MSKNVTYSNRARVTTRQFVSGVLISLSFSRQQLLLAQATEAAAVPALTWTRAARLLLLDSQEPCSPSCKSVGNTFIFSLFPLLSQNYIVMTLHGDDTCGLHITLTFFFLPLCSCGI